MAKDPTREDLPRDDEMVPADDRIIGQALRWSLVALLAIGLVVGLAVLVARRQPEAPPETTIQQSAPEVVQRPAEVPRVLFTDITDQAGIDFVHVNGATGEKLLPETMGSGAAFFDFDNDDDADLLLVNSTSWTHSPAVHPPPTQALYRNDGGGRFENVTRATGLDFSIYGTGVAAGDFDGDGHVDLFLTAVGGNRLLRNSGHRFASMRSHRVGCRPTWSPVRSAMPNGSKRSCARSRADGPVRRKMSRAPSLFLCPTWPRTSRAKC